MNPEQDERSIVSSLSKGEAASSACAAQRYNAVVTRSSLWLHGQRAACVRGCRWKENSNTLYSPCTVRRIKHSMADVTAAGPFKPIVILLWLHCVMTLFSGAIYPREKKTLL
jgi:hypothetical protein